MRGIRNVTTEERATIFEERRQVAYEAAGLNTPFVVRCLRWLQRGLTLDWGETNMGFTGRWGSRSREIREIILGSLPRSLLIFGTANLLLFLTTVLVALPLTNKHRGWLDKLIIALSPLSAVPAWVYGILLNLIALNTLGNVFAGSAFDAWPDTFKLAYVPMIMRHLVLPLLAIFLSGLFQGIYTWRIFFQLHAAEDYVELARAKGLPSGMLQRRYILRPMLPALLTSFSLIFVNLWQDAIILEQVFNITGIGSVFFKVVGYNVPGRTPFIVALVVTFAYLLAVTVFVLDVVYAIVDPRIRISGPPATVRASRSKRPPRPRRRAVLESADRSADSSRQQSLPPDTTTQRKALGNELKASDLTEGASDRPGGTRSLWQRRLRRSLKGLALAVSRLVKYPAAMIGLLIIVLLVITSIHTLITIPYDEMLTLWREGEASLIENPRNAWPAWVNRFSDRTYPETIVIDSLSMADVSDGVVRTVEVVTEDMTEIVLTFPFEFTYDAPPQDVAVFIDTTFERKRPLVTLDWLRPDGTEIQLMTRGVGPSTTYRVSQDDKLPRTLGTDDLLAALFNDPDAYLPVVEQGRYQLQLHAYVFEEDADMDAKVILYGQVFGLAGTDHSRRDLRVPLLWGLSIALGFGLVAAIVTTITSVLIAAVGTWFGGWADILVQRITEVNIILPFLPVSIMVYVLYSKSIWMILGVTVLLRTFGSSIKDYRALLLQIRDSPYIEAAKSYGASNWRIIVHYLIPRIISVLIPKVVILVPSYVFLEASLAFLGISDPVLPTWGKLIVDGLERGFYSENYHLILEPLGCLMLVSFAFVMLGISLERVFSTKLRRS